MKILYKIFGGRPMAYLGFNFTDIVSGKPVNNYRDKFGRLWMAENRWGWFRVRLIQREKHENRKRMKK